MPLDKCVTRDHFKRSNNLEMLLKSILLLLPDTHSTYISEKLFMIYLPVLVVCIYDIDHKYILELLNFIT